jgi:ubiquinone/menaquinone biosynthesis C-methylase UbiE
MSQWNHNIQYHDVLLRAVPSRCQCALDVGCGTGSFARQLALCSRDVIAIDADHDTLERGRMATPADTRVTFVDGDVMTYPFGENSFDFIAAIATLHHLPLRSALARFRSLLKPGGVLGIIGLYRARTVKDFALSAAALPTSWTIRRLRDYAEIEAPLQEPKETLHEIQTACNATLHGGIIRQHLLFRYSLVWRKP